MPDAVDRCPPREIELKLEIEAGDIEGLAALPHLSLAAAKPKLLESAYFDTPDLDLRNGGISLRVRSDGARFVQTVKAEGSRSGLAFDRGEWEFELQSASPDFRLAKETPLEPFVCREAERQKLQPIFTVRAERRVAIYRSAGAEIELAIDTGWIEAAGRRQALSEVELELKAGDPATLYAAALEIAEAVPLRLSLMAKSDRGYALLKGGSPAAVKAEPIALDAGQTAAAAFQTIARSCLRHLVANEAVLRQRADPEAVHQVRVAIRRLRAALSLFKTVVTDRQLAWVKAELKWMADQLGPARDLDVFIAVLKPAHKSLQPHPLAAEYGQRRGEAYAKATEAVKSDRFGHSVLAVAAWMEAGAWLTGERTSISAADFARAELKRRWRKARGSVKRLDRLDEDRRHRVRIGMKKLRYATEFFASLFQEPRSRKEMKRALKAVTGLQGTLGELNDIAVARSLAPPAAADDLLRAREKQAGPLLAKAARQAEEIRRVQPFWT